MRAKIASSTTSTLAIVAPLLQNLCFPATPFGTPNTLVPERILFSTCFHL
jgi:hypothetical protein